MYEDYDLIVFETDFKHKKHEQDASSVDCDKGIAKITYVNKNDEEVIVDVLQPYDGYRYEVHFSKEENQVLRINRLLTKKEAKDILKSHNHFWTIAPGKPVLFCGICNQPLCFGPRVIDEKLAVTAEDEVTMSKAICPSCTALFRVYKEYPSTAPFLHKLFSRFTK